MQSFWFFWSYPQALPSVAKRTGGSTLRARFAGGNATTNKKLKKYFWVLNNNFLSTFSRSKKLQKVQIANTIALYILNVYKLYCNTDI